MISVNTIDELNSMIRQEAPYLRIEIESSKTDDFISYNVRLQKTKYITTEYHPLNVTTDFKEDITNFLKGKGVYIGWNNTWTTFWEVG